MRPTSGSIRQPGSRTVERAHRLDARRLGLHAAGGRGQAARLADELRARRRLRRRPALDRRRQAAARRRAGRPHRAMYEPYLDEPEQLGQWVIDPERPRPGPLRPRLGFSIDSHTCGTGAGPGRGCLRRRADSQPQPQTAPSRASRLPAEPPGAETMARHRSAPLVSTPFIRARRELRRQLGQARVPGHPHARLSRRRRAAGGHLRLADHRLQPLGRHLRRRCPAHDHRPDLRPRQRLTPLEAIRAYTIGGARITGHEQTRGSLEPGKLADLVVLDRDPWSVDPEELTSVRTLATMLGGRWVYDEAPSGLGGARRCGSPPVRGGQSAVAIV